MNTSFFMRNLRSNLNSCGYRDSAREKTEQLDITAFYAYKTSGISLYQLFAINCDLSDMDILHEQLKISVEGALKNAEKLNFRSSVIIILLISEKNSSQKTELFDKISGIPKRIDIGDSIFTVYGFDFVEAAMTCSNLAADAELKLSEILKNSSVPQSEFQTNMQSQIVNFEERKKSILVKKRKPYRKAKNFHAYIILLIIITLVFLVTGIFEMNENNYERLLSLSYIDILNGEVYRLISGLFTHSGFEHFIFNSLSLYIFGSRLENAAGSLKFLLVFFISGFLSSFAYMLLNPFGYALGASGAIFGLSGALLVMAWRTKSTFEGLNAGTLSIMVFSSLFLGFILPNVANSAHIAGLVVGMIVGFIYAEIEKKKMYWW